MAHSFVYWVQEMMAKDVFAPGARIVGLTNTISNTNVDRWGLVIAAKAALEAYAHMLSLELGKQGYRVMLVNFGIVETQAVRIAFSDAEWNKLKTRMSQATATGRICTVEEVGEFVSLIMGKSAEWFNGTTIDFTGAQAKSLFDPLFNPNNYWPDIQE